MPTQAKCLLAILHMQLYICQDETQTSTYTFIFLQETKMSVKINRFRNTKNAILELQQELEALANDPDLKLEMEFEEKLRALMSEYNKSLRDINAILNPEGASTAAPKAASGARRERRTKRYTNPHTGAVIETKGGNHNGLKEWKQQWGNETVEGWAVTL